MKRLNLILVTGVFLASVPTGLSQPTITSIALNGRPQTAYDSFHPYASLSASPGADVSLTVTVSGVGPLAYQWRFHQTRLPNETNQSLRFPSLDLTNGGDYTVVVSNLSGAVTSQVATLRVDGTFTKITASPVVTNADTSQGGFWGDYNNDGYLDLFVVNGQDGFATNAFLYRNNRDGTFTQILSGPPVNVSAQAPSAGWGDYDNDGNLDLFVAATGAHLFYRNNGDGTFSRILSGLIATNSAFTYGCSWADYDNDGFLDLFVTVIDPSANSHCFLYRNNGDATFSSVTNNVLVTDRASSIGCAWGDYDNDGHLDLFECGGRGPGSPLAPNRLYHNNGDGTFTRVAAGSVGTDQGRCGSCAWGDYDNDGFLDLFVANGFGGQNFLYRNNGDGTFTRVTAGIVATDMATNWYGCAWGDYDNDGFLDLFVTGEGYTNIVPVVVNALYHNNGDGSFTKITNGSPVNEYSDSVGCCWADYDNDGFLDLFATRGDGRGNALYHNNGNTNAWLAVKLAGTVSNRSGIGAKVRVRASYRGASRWQMRQITGGGGWASQQDLRANFGLGDATNVKLVRIEWPSGIVQEFRNVAPRQILAITEPPRLLAEADHISPRFFLKGGRGMQYDIQTSTDAAAWSFAGTITVTNLNGLAEITATNPPSFDHRFYHAVSH
jgi:hypothetical protein